MTKLSPSQLMMSAIIRVRTVDGRYIEGRALLDTGSNVNLITESLARKLKIPIHSNIFSVGAVNGLHTKSTGTIETRIKSRVNEFEKFLGFIVVTKITDLVPSSTFPRHSIHIPKQIRLADPRFHIPGSIDLLIGAGATISLLSIGQINLSRGPCDLYLQKTLLGWIVVGGVINNDEDAITCNLIELGDQIRQFWELEECSRIDSRSIEDIQCEEFYAKTTKRNDSGRYVVKLPFKKNNPGLGNSREQALRRYHTLQHKFHKNPHLQIEYDRVLKDYLDQGHMSRVLKNQTEGYFMPHHAVIKPSRTTTKIRVVFDASAKSNNGQSLNNILLTGPTIQPKLFDHLLRFRCYNYVMTADIEQMYRQILVDPNDRKYQRIVWQCDRETETFELNTVTFGVSSAPFLAIRTLHQLASDEQVDFPRASEILKRDFYVDDLLTGANNLKEALLIRDEIIALLKRGGFHIRKWASNHRHVLDSFNRREFSTDMSNNEKGSHKTLGIGWLATSDEIVFSVKEIDTTRRTTKRQILSDIASIFDPIGLLGPVVFALKKIMQSCWKAKVDWDETVPQEINSRWQKFASQSTLLTGLTVSRHILVPSPIRVEVHGFCDASELGYGACIYLRSVDSQNRILVKLACSKSRVAPVKQVTIPRLELCGAILLTRLYSETREIFNFPVNKIVFWSDSKIVLAWIKKEPQTLSVFVGNRVAEIQRLSNSVEWRHVASENNLADSLSRGQTPAEFVRNKAWFDGHSWLQEYENTQISSDDYIVSELPELRKIKCLLATKTDDPINLRFSSYSRLIDVISYCLRFRDPKKYRSQSLGVEERLETEKRLLKLIQTERYAREINLIKKGDPVKSTKLSALDPFIDKDGLLRVGGRLRNAKINENQKHPIILPSYHHVTDLIIRETHTRILHSGIQSTLYTIRLRFWLLDGKNQIRKIIRKCNTCIRHRPSPTYVKMGNLPKARVEQAPIFDHVGIDFFGPILLKEKQHRNRSMIKGYGCMFICLVTKAVHLEIVADLSTDKFLAAFRRFVARRGVPSNIYSDNGTNFVGANNELRELYALYSSKPFRDVISSHVSQLRIKWNFNPPLSPHFGGLWESAIKSFKHHFYRVVGNKSLTFEEFCTLASEIEAVLNSRPLVSMSSDPNDPAVLTPAHFLIGRPFTTLPEKNYITVPESRLSVWRFITRVRQDFWTRWHLEYLSEIQKRQKWLDSKGEITLGDVVIIIDKNQPCCHWPLGVVIDTFPGNDGLVRVVKIKTAQGEYVRNVTKLCLLPHVKELIDK